MTNNQIVKRYEHEDHAVSSWKHAMIMFGGGLDLCVFDKCDESSDNIIYMQVPNQGGSG